MFQWDNFRKLGIHVPNQKSEIQSQQRTYRYIEAYVEHKD